MRGDAGEELRLAVAFREDPLPGARLVSVTVTVENIGGVAFAGDLARYTWLIDAAHGFHGRSIVRTGSEVSRLGPGQAGARTVVFEVPPGARLIRFRLSLRPGAAARTQDWYLI